MKLSSSAFIVVLLASLVSAAHVMAQTTSSVGSTPDELAAFLKNEIARYGEVIRKGNITPQ